RVGARACPGGHRGLPRRAAHGARNLVVRSVYEDGYAVIESFVPTQLANSPQERRHGHEVPRHAHRQGRYPLDRCRWILPLPQDASAQLPSRGQVAATGELDGHQVRTVLEPDGRMGHWVSLDAALPDTSQLRETEVLAFTFTTASTWSEPDVPEHLSAALEA